MSSLVNLPAPSGKGTYFALFEPGVVKIRATTCISRRLTSVRLGTYRKVALLAWSSLPERQVYRRFEADRITPKREFFRLSADLLSFINECRVGLGFSFVEEVQLWEFGGPLPPEEATPQSRTTKGSSFQVSPEEMARLGRYHTHLRWHLKKPKPSCEFCILVKSEES